MTNSSSIFVAISGVAFLTLAASIFWKQSKAKRCESHNPTAGYAAIVLAILSAVTGLALVVVAVIF